MRGGNSGAEVTAADTQMDGMEMNEENQAAGVEGDIGPEIGTALVWS